MVDEDMVDEDIEQMRRELGTAQPVREEHLIELKEIEEGTKQKQRIILYRH